VKMVDAQGDASGGRALEAQDAVADECGQHVEFQGVVSAVKMKLNTFAKNKQLVARIRTLVYDMDQIIAEAYLFANFHVVRLLEEGKDVPAIGRPFYYRCLLAVSANCNVRKNTLSDEFLTSIEKFDALRPPSVPDTRRKVDAADYNQVFGDASITMATMATNHLWMNLERRLETYLKWSCPELKAFHKSIVRAVAIDPRREIEEIVVMKSSKRKRFDRMTALMLKARAIASDLRSTAPSIPPSTQRYDNRASLTIPLYHRILRETEQAHRDHVRKSLEKANPSSSDGTHEKSLPKRFQGRMFSLLPMKNGYTVSHIPISSMMLKALLKKTGLEVFKGDGRDEAAGHLWAKYFNLNTLETVNRRFANRICTDGYAVSALLNVSSGAPASVSDREANLQKAIKAFASLGGEGVVVSGLDPGITDVFVTASTSMPSVSMSSKEYYHLSKVNYSKPLISRWNDEGSTWTSERAPEDCYNGRTACLSTLERYASWYLSSLSTLLMHRRVRGYRKLRFCRYGHKLRSINEMCDRIAPRDKTVIVGFGDWQGPKDSPISRKTVGPLSELKKALALRPNVILLLIDEYLTSRTDSDTHLPLTNMKGMTTRHSRDGKKYTVRGKIHKVLHCRTSDGRLPEGCKQTTWNRDTNAARNILNLLLHELRGLPRPEVFRRPTKRSQTAGTDAV